MISPARAHFIRVTAALAAESAQANAPLQDCSQYELMLLKLNDDRRRLKGVQSTEAKAALKRELLPDYAPWIEGVLAAGHGAQDDVLMTIMLWRIDAGDYAAALAIADYAIRYQLAMPDQFARTTATVIAEELADAAKRARDGQQPFDVTVLLATAELTQAQDMPDQVRAKLHKEIGLLLEPTDPASALQHLTRAKQLHDKVGVVKDIERLQKLTKQPTDRQSVVSG
ncbi:phage terminase small subunit [Chitinivorax sp. B]|uniref:phage terminase small subunit n=1 Tax=Chitinivorax sp. B TaxID=2502235 RepID=UPI0010F6F47B|nr:phage terminase small subunit [Chitinivorax sp. B]